MTIISRTRNIGTTSALRTVKLLFFSLFLIAAVPLTTYQFTGYPNIHPYRPERLVPPWDIASGEESVLVIAPHCDDETLGCGGLLWYATQYGNRVRVVVLTNGDGYPAAATLNSEGERPFYERHLQLGQTRQQETLAALRVLGVEAENVSFLGYPDGGLSHLWLNHWEYDNPYTSPYTMVNRSPYSSSFTPNAPYCGRAVVDDLCAIIREFRPSLVFVPHPNDTHADHWATFAFTTAALQTLVRQEQLETDMRVLTYIVHRGNWPIPRAYAPSWSLDPPKTLQRVPYEWIYQPLFDDAVTAKRRALAEYRSQMQVMRLYLLSFVRQNELFAVPHSPVAEALGHAGSSESIRDAFWEEAEPVVFDPLDDTLVRRIRGAADLSSVSAALNGDTLYLMIRSRTRTSTNMRYTLHLCDFSDKRTMITLSVGPGYAVNADSSLTKAGLRVRRTVGGIEIGIPLRVFARSGTQQRPDAVFFMIQSSIARTSLDRTAWTVLRLSPDAPNVFR
ncbi:MAG: PIG-L family deacetylase [Firmicutes bacterium]|nr:PIG-L family deacetylase [Bacillota bacterium]